jgi:hypothetical protein
LLKGTHFRDRSSHRSAGGLDTIGRCMAIGAIRVIAAVVII